jgi:hypothetical protein
MHRKKNLGAHTTYVEDREAVKKLTPLVLRFEYLVIRDQCIRLRI